MREWIPGVLVASFFVSELTGLRGVVAEGMSTLRHMVRMLDVLLLMVRMHRVLRVLSVVLGVTVHHHALMNSGVVSVVCRVDGWLSDKHLLVVLASWAWVSTCATWRRRSTVRGVRTWTPVVEVFVFFNVHQTCTYTC